MPRKVRELKAQLRKAGTIQISQVGSHTKWQHALVPGLHVVLSGHDGDDAKPYQEKGVRELLELVDQAQRSQQT